MHTRAVAHRYLTVVADQTGDALTRLTAKWASCPGRWPGTGAGVVLIEYLHSCGTFSGMSATGVPAS
ncbi:hypothetical protein [Streptomyces edwardsiae]|uniref:Transposase n=1 Tax=Streptomyces edwardsiae TaxID=3075527 RepID=A0ABU2PPT0_9ACTN|nr:hypothetical protein [Streptomyces sp. DSM 41636]MDT0393738.1 hypothetical protein [Streptomyces sp. DSM 41636]